MQAQLTLTLSDGDGAKANKITHSLGLTMDTTTEDFQQALRVMVSGQFDPYMTTAFAKFVTAIEKAAKKPAKKKAIEPPAPAAEEEAQG